MAPEIVWTKSALADLENISTYIFNEFGKVHFIKFREKLETKLMVVVAQPLIGSITKKDRYLRKTHVSKITILIYRYKPRKNIVEILQLWDGRRGPKSMVS